MARVIVERAFDQPASFADIQAREDQFAWCLEQHRVKFIRSYFSKDRRRMICEYEAPDAETVREVQRTASMPFERIWTAEAFEWE
ncbi:MAG: hypothetical protein AMJ62_07510 [Myxococcales bacterium SG8_38]|nr:MAG: hypothetical protein AMJ62_07510 [Myxococcales bacterium SG8_38]